MLKVVVLVLAIAASSVRSKCTFYKLDIDQAIPPGTECTAPTGRLAFQTDGNVVIYDNAGQPLWTTNTGLDRRYHRDEIYFHFQADGNFVIYRKFGVRLGRLVPKFSTETYDTGYRFVFEDDRNLVMYDRKYKELFTTNTNQTACAILKNTYEDVDIPLGYECKVATGRFVIQTDGNMVIFDSAGKPIWTTNTSSKDERYVEFRKDGNFVVSSAGTVNLQFPGRNKPPSIIWSSGTSGKGSRLVFQHNRNLVIYDNKNKAVWSSNTEQH